MKPKCTPKLLLPDWPTDPNVFACTVLKGSPLHPGLPEMPRLLHQVHGNQVISWDQTAYDSTLEADASWTTKPHVVCAVRTADCVPIVLFEPNTQMVAAIHAGWKGLACGVIDQTLRGKSMKGAYAWIGPCISKAHYEVDRVVYDAFENKRAFVNHGEDHWLLDLRHEAKVQLVACGLDASLVFQSARCTWEDPELESYRRSGKQTGHITTLIYRNDA